MLSHGRRRTVLRTFQPIAGLGSLNPPRVPVPDVAHRSPPEGTAAAPPEGQETGTCLPRHGSLHPPAGRAAPKTTRFKSLKEEPQDGNRQFSRHAWAVREGCRRKSCHFGDSFSRTQDIIIQHLPVTGTGDAFSADTNSGGIGSDGKPLRLGTQLPHAHQQRLR